ncbi:MAG: hypothetical protein L0Z70_10350 [Chloroflexi bacterium]|nr:hypothetical protein [Chloroflexota bacterium]
MTTVLETHTIFTALGIRFWDAVRQAQVRDGLAVRAYPLSDPLKQVKAYRAASGAYAFQGLPGLRGVEYPGSAPPVAAEALRYVVSVNDALGRFLPVVFFVDLPLPHSGLYLSNNGGALPGFHLFSAPSRAAAPGIAALRATLLEQGSQRPAAHAVLQAEVEGSLWAGIADGRGCVALLFPYPNVESGLGGPPGSLRGPLQDETWQVTLSVLYQPQAQITPPGASLPELRSVLQQNPTAAWLTQAGPPVNAWQATLAYGRDLVLRTEGLSSLWVSV